MKKWVKCNNSKQWYKYLTMKRLTNIQSTPVYRWLFWLWTPNKYEYQKMLYKQGQRTFIYCPHCDQELISSKSHIPTDVPLLTEFFQCKNCYHLSEWNFDVCVPVLVKDYGNGDECYKQLEEIGYYDTEDFEDEAKTLMEELDY